MSKLIPTKDLYSGSSVGGFVFYAPNLDWRTFYQNKDGSLYAMGGDSGPGQEVVKPGGAKLGTSIVSVSHGSTVGRGSTTFYINPQNEVCVFVSGGLSLPSGSLKDSNGKTFVARPDSEVAAFAWVVNNTAHVRVAYQLGTNEVQQINWDGNKAFRWTFAFKSPPTGQGASLSFINQSPTDQDQYFRGYYQHSNNTIMELVNEPSKGYIGSFNQPLTNKTRISASYPATLNAKFARAQGQVAVNWVNSDGTVGRRVLDNNQWGSAYNLDSSIRVKQGAGLMAWSYTPKDATSPVTNRLLWVGADGKLYARYL